MNQYGLKEIVEIVRDYITVICVTAYIFGAFIMYGVSYNSYECADAKYIEKYYGSYVGLARKFCENDRSIFPVFPALLWPVIVPAKIAIYVTK